MVVGGLRWSLFVNKVAPAHRRQQHEHHKTPTPPPTTNDNIDHRRLKLNEQATADVAFDMCTSDQCELSDAHRFADAAATGVGWGWG